MIQPHTHVTYSQYGIAVPALTLPIPQTSRWSAEQLLTAVPGGHLVVRHESVQAGIHCPRRIWGPWADVPATATQPAAADQQASPAAA